MKVNHFKDSIKCIPDFFNYNNETSFLPNKSALASPNNYKFPILDAQSF